jgi:hypothetical protein
MLVGIAAILINSGRESCCLLSGRRVVSIGDQ